MIQVKEFIFNPFYENTYLLYDESLECVIADPGCSNHFEQQELNRFIESKKLKPVRLLNTHSHIDHIFGNRFVYEKYNLLPETAEGEAPGLRAADVYADNFGVHPPKSPDAEKFLKQGDVIEFGNSKLEVLSTPGHSIAHLAFFCRGQEFIISGDVLFRESIGRTDLPGGNYKTLMETIRLKLLPLGDNIKVYPGHGVSTTIGYERQHNPFILQEHWS